MTEKKEPVEPRAEINKVMGRLSEQEINRIREIEERCLLLGEYEEILLSKHDKILIGNALQVYIDHNEAMLKDGYALGEGIFIMEKSIAEAKELINKFKEW